MRKQIGWYSPHLKLYCYYESKKDGNFDSYTIPVFIDDISGHTAIEDIKKQFSEDVCKESSCGRPAEGGLAEIGSICQNRPPEITNLMNACLACNLRETCKLLFCK